MNASSNLVSLPSLDSLQARFVAVLPRIETHARIYFRHLKCADRKEEAVAETLALSWKWFVRLAEKGKDASTFVFILATLAARAVRSGRRVCGQERARDALSPVAQQRHNFTVGKLPNFETLSDNPLMEALHDNTVSPVPDQVCFRLDFAQWLNTLSERNRQIAQDMALGYQTTEIAQKYKVCPSRISQLRREFQEDWTHLCDDLLEQSDFPLNAVA